MLIKHQSGAYYPQIVEFELFFWEGSGKWSIITQNPLQRIRFKALGQSFGSKRWRPHLILYKDDLPQQSKKELRSMLQTIRQAISTILGVDCMQITADLVDSDIKEEG